MKNLILIGIAVLASTVFSSLAKADYDIECSSQGYRYASCYVPNGGSVRLIRQLSYPTNEGGYCLQGQTWGYTGNSIWVDRGCRAVFRVSEGWGGGNYPQGGVQQLTCSSEGYRYNTCGVYVGRGSVQLIQQLSYPTNEGGICQYGRTWGFSPNGIWVDRGCRAVFQVYPR